MNKAPHHAFETAEQLHAWLRANHASEPELWVRIFKKATGQPSITWDDCVVAAITWGWIDGLRNALDDISFLQRLTPRCARRRALGKRLRRHRRHGDARRLSAGAATRPRSPRLLRHPQAAKPIRHLLPAAHRPSARKPGRSAWRSCWRGWRAAKARDIRRQCELGLIASVDGKSGSSPHEMCASSY